MEDGDGGDDDEDGMENMQNMSDDGWWRSLIPPGGFHPKAMLNSPCPATTEESHIPKIQHNRIMFHSNNF